jgi:hypothetical protein
MIHSPCSNIFAKAATEMAGILAASIGLGVQNVAALAMSLLNLANRS